MHLIAKVHFFCGQAFFIYLSMPYHFELRTSHFDPSFLLRAGGAQCDNDGLMLHYIMLLRDYIMLDYDKFYKNN